jgi:tRNA(Ile)-lysidine synthase
MPKARENGSAANAAAATARVVDTPLTVAELAAILERIGGVERAPFIAVGVSGGPDSLALMLLADRWARQRGGRAWGLTVDHRLRSESVAEARTVGGWLAARGIPHEILTWTDEKPAAGIQEAARNARYRLLTAWCRANGCLHLLTAHHREDQAETYLIRRGAGSGVDGLAAMSAVRQLPGCRLVRPLLTISRARLTALLTAEAQPFVRDPSNFNPVYERARLRQQASPADMANAAEEARIRGHRRIEREQTLQRLIGSAVGVHPAGFAVIDPAILGDAPVELREPLLERVARCIGGAPYPLRRDRLARLRIALETEPGRARTLGGCGFVPWRSHILVIRELAAAAPAFRLDPGGAVCWDRRFAVLPWPQISDGLTLGHLGPRRVPDLPRYETGLPRLVHAVLPAFWDPGGLVSVPHLGYRRAGAETLPTIVFRPANPLTPAVFTVV